jgi:hypothetical protein
VLTVISAWAAADCILMALVDSPLSTPWRCFFGGLAAVGSTLSLVMVLVEDAED